MQYFQGKSVYKGIVMGPFADGAEAEKILW